MAAVATPTKSPRWAKILGWGIGAAVGILCGWRLFALSGAFLLVWLIGRIVKTARGPMLWAIAWQANYAVILLAGSAITGRWSAAWLDLSALPIGLIWLWIKPGWPPIILLSVYHIWGIIANSTSLFSAWVDVDAQKWLALHLLIRAVSIALMGFVLAARRRMPPLQAGRRPEGQTSTVSGAASADAGHSRESIIQSHPSVGPTSPVEADSSLPGKPVSAPELKPYGVSAPCPACGVAGAKSKYKHAGGYDSKTGKPFDVILRTCGNCGYKWKERTLDDQTRKG